MSGVPGVSASMSRGCYAETAAVKIPALSGSGSLAPGGEVAILDTIGLYDVRSKA